MAAWAKTLADDALRSLKEGAVGKVDEAYYVKATSAEAVLVLARIPEADKALAEAIACDPRNYPAHAGTLRQFKIISEALDLDTAWLDRHRPPPALFYCGHMFNDQASNDQAGGNKDLTARLDADARASCLK